MLLDAYCDQTIEKSPICKGFCRAKGWSNAWGVQRQFPRKNRDSFEGKFIVIGKSYRAPVQFQAPRRPRNASSCASFWIEWQQR